MNSRASMSMIAVALLLSACAASTVESDFLCEAPTGTPCASIAESDGGGYAVARARGGVAGDGLHERSSPALGGRGLRNGNVRAAPQPIPFEDPPTVAGVPQTVVAGDALYGAEVVNPVLFREPERVTTLWIAPYVGQNGYLHQPGYVHFVVERGRWFGPGGVSGGVRAPTANAVVGDPALRDGRPTNIATTLERPKS